MKRLFITVLAFLMLFSLFSCDMPADKDPSESSSEEASDGVPSGTTPDAPRSALRIGFRAFGEATQILTVSEYDENGRITREYYDPVLNGSVGSRRLLRAFHYAEDGAPLSVTLYDGVVGLPHGKPTLEVAFDASEGGKPTVGYVYTANTEPPLMTGAYVTLTYDDAGNRRTETYYDAEGAFDYQFVYSETGMLTDQVTENTHYRLYYDSTGALTRIERRAILFDTEGKTYRDKLIYDFRYQEDGRVTHGENGDYYVLSDALTVTEARFTESGACRLVTVDYDANLRLTSYHADVSFPNGDASASYRKEHTVTYTADGKPHTRVVYTVQNGERTLSEEASWSYDANGNLTRYSSKEPAYTREHLYTYDADGRILEYVYSPGTDTYAYNASGYPERWEYSSAYSSCYEEYTYAFDGAGRLARRVTEYDEPMVSCVASTEIETYEYAADGTVLSYGFERHADVTRGLRRVWSREGSTHRESVAESRFGREHFSAENLYTFDALGRLVSCTYAEDVEYFPGSYTRYSETMQYSYE